MSRRLSIGTLTVALAIAVAWWLARDAPRAPVSAGEPTPGGTNLPPQPIEPSPPRAPAPSVASPQPSAAVVGEQRDQGSTRMQQADATKLRAAILEAIRAAKPDVQPTGSETPNPADVPERPSVPTLDRTYIRAAIDDIKPLIQECFDLSRQERPELHEARAVVSFSIIGDERLGGVIEQSRIDAHSEGMTPALSECVRETMYSLKLRAPEGRGRVEVTYPFRLVAPDSKPTAKPGDPAKPAP